MNLNPNFPEKQRASCSSGEGVRSARWDAHQVQIDFFEALFDRLKGADFDAALDESSDQVGYVVAGGDGENSIWAESEAGGGANDQDGAFPRVRVEAIAKSLADEVGPFPLKDHVALVEDGDPVADLFDLGEKMGGEQNSHAVLAIESQDEVAHLVDALGVEAFGGFVEEDEIGPREKGLGKGEALAHAVAVNADGIVDALFEPDEADGLEELGIAAGGGCKR